MKKTEIIKRAFSIRKFNKGAVLQINVDVSRTVKHGRETISADFFSFSLEIIEDNQRDTKAIINAVAERQHEKREAVAMLQSLNDFLRDDYNQALLSLGAPVQELIIDKVMELSKPEKREL